MISYNCLLIQTFFKQADCSGKNKETMRAHQCLTRKWLLSQFDSVMKAAEQGSHHFVKEGLDRKEVKAQGIIGREDFMDDLAPYISGYRNIVDNPQSQRHMARPGLEGMFTDNILHDISYILVAIVKKTLNLNQNLYTICKF
jgi:hypothetical protein